MSANTAEAKISELKVLSDEYQRKIHDPEISSVEKAKYLHSLAEVRNRICVLQSSISDPEAEAEKRRKK